MAVVVALLTPAACHTHGYTQDALTGMEYPLDPNDPNDLNDPKTLMTLKTLTKDLNADISRADLSGESEGGL